MIAANLFLLTLGTISLAMVLVCPLLIELFVQAVQLPGVEQRIGAMIVCPWVQVGDEFEEVITFAEVSPNGACGRVGIVSGDIIVSDRTIGALCQRINASPDGVVIVSVVDGGNGPPIGERRQRNLVLKIP